MAFIRWEHTHHGSSSEGRGSNSRRSYTNSYWFAGRKKYLRIMTDSNDGAQDILRVCVAIVTEFIFPHVIISPNADTFYNINFTISCILNYNKCITVE